MRGCRINKIYVWTQVAHWTLKVSIKKATLCKYEVAFQGTSSYLFEKFKILKYAIIIRGVLWDGLTNILKKEFSTLPSWKINHF